MSDSIPRSKPGFTSTQESDSKSIGSDTGGQHSNKTGDILSCDKCAIRKQKRVQVEIP
jgi:hypothetical protein